MDPFSLVLAGAAAAGVAGKLAERLTDYLSDLIKGQDAAVQEQAARNAAAFIEELGKQIERVGRERPIPDLDRALCDPDVASTMRTAMVGAARTSSKEKHDALASAVAERLAAEAESNDALASALAVEAIPKLSALHLRFLGIAAVVFVVRPLPDWYFATPIDGDVLATPKGSRYPSYSAWLKGSLNHLHLQVELNQLQIAHLASIGCLTYERKLRRDLAAALRPKLGFFDPRAGVDVRVMWDIGEFLLLDAVGKDLRGLWDYGLQHVTLTPVGSLIGTAVYESVGGDPVEISWSKADPPNDAVLKDLVWDGRVINEEFMKALDQAVADRAGRRVGPWHRLDTD